MLAENNYAVDDEFGNQIETTDGYPAAMQVARRYLAAHKDAPHVTIREDKDGGESWELSRHGF